MALRCAEIGRLTKTRKPWMSRFNKASTGSTNIYRDWKRSVRLFQYNSEDLTRKGAHRLD